MIFFSDPRGSPKIREQIPKSVFPLFNELDIYDVAVFRYIFPDL